MRDEVREEKVERAVPGARVCWQHGDGTDILSWAASSPYRWAFTYKGSKLRLRAKLTEGDDGVLTNGAVEVSPSKGYQVLCSLLRVFSQ